MNPVSLWDNVTQNAGGKQESNVGLCDAIKMHQFDQITSDKNFLLTWLEAQKYQFHTTKKSINLEEMFFCTSSCTFGSWRKFP